MQSRILVAMICGAALMSGCSALAPGATGEVHAEASFTIPVPTEEPTPTNAPTPAPSPQPTPEPTYAPRPLPEDYPLGEPPASDPYAVTIRPESEQGSWAVGETRDIELGHCGLAMPIDEDGSLWDPTYGHDGSGGPLTDDQKSDLVNDGRATFTLTNRDTFEVITEHGAVMTLLRHEGSRRYGVCA